MYLFQNTDASELYEILCIFLLSYKVCITSLM